MAKVVSSKNYALKKVRHIILEDIVTGRTLAKLTQLNNVQLTSGQEQVEALGKDGVKLAIFEKGKTFSIKATDGMISEGYLALQTGSAFEEIKNGKGAKISETLVTADGQSVTITYKPVGVVGNEIGFIYRDDNGNNGESFTQNGQANADSFAFAPTTKVITLPTGKFKAGDKVIVEYFPEFTSVKKLVNKADSYSANVRVRLDAYFTEICTKADVPLQLVIETGKVSGNIDLSFGDSAATQNVEIEAMTNVCSEDNELFTLYTYNMEDIKK